MEDRKQEKEELEASYQEEMEQPVSEAIDPGRDIAKAYRLLREKKWRIAMIYLDHLEKKYPNWDSIYMAKAMTHYILNETVFMKKALGAACRLGNNTACSDLQNIKKLHGDYLNGLKRISRMGFRYFLSRNLNANVSGLLIWLRA